MTKSAVLSNYLWVPKAAVKKPPEVFAKDWLYEIELLKTPEGRIAQQQIAFLRAQAESVGDDPADLIDEISEDDNLVIRNWSEVGDWWALCAGNLPKVEALVKKLGLPLKDQRVEVPLEPEIRERLKMVMKPRDYQPKPFKQWFNAGYGIFHAAPAFGKTFIMNWAVVDRGQRTIVLVPPDQLAEQFITRFRYGSEAGDGEFNPVTNCLEVERDIGRPIVGRYRAGGELFPITVATWQSFISTSGKKALKAINKSFGFLLADEAHVFAAPAPAGVVNGFHAKVKQGVTATPERKDQMEVGLYDVLGPVTAEGHAPQVPVTAYLIATGCAYPARRGLARRNEFGIIVNWLLKQPDRNDLIVDWLHTDIQNGRTILVLSDRVQWCLDMAKRLTEEGVPSRAVIGGMTSKKGMKSRDGIIKAMMEGDIKIIFATQVFKQGVDIPILDTLYDTCPSSNLPQLQQKLGRIRRTREGKTSTIYRYFVDEGHGLLWGCARGTHKFLVAEGCTVLPVQVGRKPGVVMSMGGLTQSTAGPQKVVKSGLRSIANRQSTAMSDLFSDLKSEERSKMRYAADLGKKP
jgi:superfamily II DNA or RNA helicase